MPKNHSFQEDINSDRLILLSAEKSILNNLILNICVAVLDDLVFYRDDNQLIIDGFNLFTDKIITIVDLIYK